MTRVSAAVSDSSPSTDSCDYVSYLDWDGNGHVSDISERVVFALNSRRWLGPWNWKAKDLSITDPSGGICYAVTRAGPCSRNTHALLEGDTVIGKIRGESPFGTKYTIALDGGLRYALSLPLFSVHFRGQAEHTEGTILIRMLSHHVWLARIDRRIDGPRLLAGLAFIHRQRIRS